MNVLIAALLALTLGVSPMQASLNGSFALQNGSPRTQGHLVARQIGTSPVQQHLDLWLTGDRSETLRHYTIDMTKYLHLIAISDDFSTFLHVHPVLGSDGHFRLDLRFPKPDTYHVYADSDPSGIGKQVFRYDLQVGSSTAHVPNVAPTGSRMSAGPYLVSLTSTHLHVGSENELTLHITRGGKPATDLHPYLGALAHAVFIDAKDLSYAHVHPMPLGHGGDAMSGMSGMSMPEQPIPQSQTTPADMMLHVAVHEPGTYKLWLQFRGGGALYAAPFVLTAAQRGETKHGSAQSELPDYRP